MFAHGIEDERHGVRNRRRLGAAQDEVREIDVGAEEGDDTSDAVGHGGVKGGGGGEFAFDDLDEGALRELRG